MANENFYPVNDGLFVKTSQSHFASKDDGGELKDITHSLVYRGNDQKVKDYLATYGSIYSASRFLCPNDGQEHAVTANIELSYTNKAGVSRQLLRISGQSFEAIAQAWEDRVFDSVDQDAEIRKEDGAWVAVGNSLRNRRAAIRITKGLALVENFRKQVELREKLLSNFETAKAMGEKKQARIGEKSAKKEARLSAVAKVKQMSELKKLRPELNAEQIQKLVEQGKFAEAKSKPEGKDFLAYDVLMGE